MDLDVNVKIIAAIYELDKNLTISAHDLFAIAWTLDQFPESEHVDVELEDIGYPLHSFPASFNSYDKDHYIRMSMTWKTVTSICVWIQDTDWSTRTNAGTGPALKSAVDSVKFMLLRHRSLLNQAVCSREEMQGQIPLELLKGLQMRLNNINDMFNIVDSDAAVIFGLHGELDDAVALLIANKEKTAAELIDELKAENKDLKKRLAGLNSMMPQPTHNPNYSATIDNRVVVKRESGTRIKRETGDDLGASANVPSRQGSTRQSEADGAESVRDRLQLSPSEYAELMQWVEDPVRPKTLSNRPDELMLNPPHNPPAAQNRGAGKNAHPQNKRDRESLADDTAVKDTKRQQLEVHPPKSNRQGADAF